MTPLPWLRTFLSSPLPSLPSSSFHPCKIASPSLSIYLSISISISLQTLQSAPRYYLSLLERGTHTIPAHARADLQYRTNGIIHDRCTIRPFLFFSLSPSLFLSRPLIFLSFNPGALGLCNFSPRGVIIHSRHRRREKMPRPPIADSETRFQRRSNGIARGDSFIVVQQHVVHIIPDVTCYFLFFFLVIVFITL